MVDTSSTRDPFTRRGTPGRDPFAAAQDKFKRSGSPSRSAGDAFKPPQGGKGGDAFARKAAPAKSAAPKLQPASTRAFDPFAAPPANPAPEQQVVAPAREVSFAPVTTEPRQARLEVVARRAEPTRVEAAVGGASELRQAEAKQPGRRVGKAATSSSLVLVSSGGAVAAETLEAPPPVVTEPPKPVVPKAEVPPAPKPAVRRSGGGSGSGAGGGGGAQSIRRFNQDDAVGILLGLAVIALLLMWWFSDRDGEQLAEDGMVSPQFAAASPAAAPPPAPLVDPFGNAPVDLKPKGPIPESTPDAAAAGSATIAAAPAPAETAREFAVTAELPKAAPVAPVAPATADMRLHAWFCTKQSEITPASNVELQKSVARFREAFGDKPLVVRGFADTRGTTDFNVALSGARASVVADFLRASGLNVAETVAVGELPDLADNQNCANQRRVDVFVRGADLKPSVECLPPEETARLICS